MRIYWPVIIILIVLFFIHDQSYAQYLVPGTGLEGNLEIGELKNQDRQGNIWHTHESGLQFKVDEKGRVILIKCQDSEYPTDRNVRIGSPESDVLRWYGAAREKIKSKEAILYSYLGISFAIKDKKVIGIYIFPRYLLKK